MFCQAINRKNTNKARLGERVASQEYAGRQQGHGDPFQEKAQFKREIFLQRSALYHIGSENLRGQEKPRW